MSEELSGDKLLDTLEELRKKLGDLATKLENSGVERTVALRDNLGHDCPFYVKSLKLFFKRDYLELRDLVQTCGKLFDEVESGDSPQSANKVSSSNEVEHE